MEITKSNHTEPAAAMPTKAVELVPRDKYQPAGNTIKLPDGVELTPKCIKWPTDRDLTTVEWQTIGAALTYMEERCGWWVLDWWVYEENKKYGDLTKLATAIGRKPKTLHNKASVARQVPPSRRREDLGVSIHAEVAALKPEDQVKWLAAAAKHKLSKVALRESIKRGEVVRGVKGKGVYFGVSDILDTTDTDGNVVLGAAASALAGSLKRLPLLPLQNCTDAETLRFWIERLEPFVNLQSVCRERLLAIEQSIEPPTAEPPTNPAATAAVEALGTVGPTDIVTPATTITSNAPQAAPADAALESAAEPSFGTKLLTIPTKLLKKLLADVAFAAETEFTELFDNFAFFFSEDGLFVMASNNRQAALVRVPPETASYVTDNTKILVNCEKFTARLRQLETTGEIVLWADGADVTMSHVTKVRTTNNRIQMPPVKIRALYPNGHLRTNVEYGCRIEIPNKRDMIAALKLVLASSSMVMIKADTGKNEIELFGEKQKPVVVGCAGISKGLPGIIALPAAFLIRCLRRIDGEKVTLSYCPDKKWAAIQSENPNYLYIMQRIRPQTA